MKKNIIEKLQKLLTAINDVSIKDYHQNIEELTQTVNLKMEARVDITTLIGGHPLDLMRANHAHHANFMYNVFLTKDAKATYDTYIWAYHTYTNKGFLYRYFYHELIQWKTSLEQMNRGTFSSIIELYEYLISLHDYFVENSITSNTVYATAMNQKMYENFLDALLTSDVELALSISNDFIKKDGDIKLFWEDVILPSLYTIGHKWEIAEISVGEEHTATSICQRVMAEHYSKILTHIENKTKILVTTSPNELHEVGSRMLADILELNGYDVYFFSSNSTPTEICDTIIDEEINFITISTTLISNISQTAEMVKRLREACNHHSFKIIVGGQAYKNNNLSNEVVKADYCLSNVAELIVLLKGN